MSEDGMSKKYVKVVDRAGKQFICPVEVLKNPDEFTDEELKECWDSASAAFTAAEEYAIIREEVRKELE
jgi:hypothetical protein